MVQKIKIDHRLLCGIGRLPKSVIVSAMILTLTLILTMPEFSFAAAISNDMLMMTDVDLTSILQVRGYDSAEIRAVMVTTPADDPSKVGAWQSGIVSTSGQMQLGSFGIQTDHRDISFAPEAALRLVPGLAGLSGINVDACAGGHCRPVAVEAIAPSRYVIRSEGVAYTVNAYSDICTPTAVHTSQPTEKSCEVLLPSWTLAHLVERGDGSIPQFPSVLAVVQLSGRILLIDLGSNSIAFDMKLEAKEPTNDLGRLNSAIFAVGGKLVMSFERGGLLIDFPRDMVVAANAEGALFVKDGGIGKGDLLGFTPVAEQVGGRVKSSAKLLVLGPNLLVTDRSAVRFSYGVDAGFTLLGTLDSDGTWRHAQVSWRKESAVSILSIAGKNAAALDLDAIDAKNLKLIPHGKTHLGLIDASRELRLVAGEIYLRRFDGWAVPSILGEAAIMAIPGTRLTEQLLPSTGSVFVQNARLGARECDWTRHKRAASAVGSYREDGVIQADCAAKVEFNLANAVGDEAVSVLAANGLLKTYLFRPAPKTIEPHTGPR